MNYLELNSTILILETVANNNGLYTWYNIVKTVDQIEGVEKFPPTYEVLKELIAIDYLRIDPSDGGNFAKYFITQVGKDFLQRIKP
jgi:hypothetical protein